MQAKLKEASAAKDGKEKRKRKKAEDEEDEGEDRPDSASKRQRKKGDEKEKRRRNKKGPQMQIASDPTLPVESTFDPPEEVTTRASWNDAEVKAMLREVMDKKETHMMSSNGHSTSEPRRSKIMTAKILPNIEILRNSVRRWLISVYFSQSTHFIPTNMIPQKNPYPFHF